MIDLLFVYGTLMQEFKSEITSVLRNNSKFLGEGWITGQLFDIGSYPGLVYHPQSAQQVRGEIYKMHFPELLLPLLDQYEMINSDSPAENEYRRDLVPVKSQGEVFNCWTYIFQLPPDPFPEINSGDYSSYFTQNPKHQDFIDKNGSVTNPTSGDLQK